MRVRDFTKGYAVTDSGVVVSGKGGVLSPDRGVRVRIGGKWLSVAYIVARAFVPNPGMRPYVRHRNGDPTDNRAVNLEWAEEPERRPRRKGYSRPFGRFGRDGAPMGAWDSLAAAEGATGVRARSIRDCLHGRTGSAGGYYWRWL